MSFSALWHLGLERSLVLTYIRVEYRDRLFLDNEIEGPLLTYDQMSGNDSLSCTNSLVTIIVVINHRNIPWGPRCLQPAAPAVPQSPQIRRPQLRMLHVCIWNKWVQPKIVTILLQLEYPADYPRPSGGPSAVQLCRPTRTNYLSGQVSIYTADRPLQHSGLSAV